MYIKGLFSCQHLSSNLSVDRLNTKVREDSDFVVWMCDCTCNCGERNIEQKFSFPKWLGDPEKEYPKRSEQRSEYEEATK